MPFVWALTVVALGACSGQDPGAGRDERLGAALVQLASGSSDRGVKVSEDHAAVQPQPDQASGGSNGDLGSLVAVIAAKQPSASRPKDSAVAAEVPASAPKPHKPRPHRYPGFRRWSGRDCTAIIRHNDGYCESRDCTAIIRNDDGYCESRDCTAYIRNDDGYCESRDCTAILRHNDGYCESRDCTAYIRNNDSYCETSSCTAIVRHNDGYCS